MKFTGQRLFFALAVATVLAAPASFAAPWKNDTIAAGLIAANFPGILFTGRHYPPEGYPGESVPHFIVMLIVQACLWYLVLSVAQRRKR